MDLFVPVARRVPIVYGSPDGVLSKNYQARAAVLRAKREAQDLSQIFRGRADKPQQEIVVVGPDGKTPILVAGLGVTEVAELEDTIQEAMERAEDRIKKEGQVVPTRRFREDRGLPSREESGQRIREALTERRKR
jgi:hypothetical protein